MDFGYFLRRLDQGSYVDPLKEAVAFKEERNPADQPIDNE